MLFSCLSYLGTIMIQNHNEPIHNLEITLDLNSHLHQDRKFNTNSEKEQ